MQRALCEQRPFLGSTGRGRRAMNNSRTLGLVLIAPAVIMVVLFFLMPVLLTAAFSFTSMSTATGISGGAYLAGPNTVRQLSTTMPKIAEQLTESKYVVDKTSLASLAEAGVSEELITELRQSHLGDVFPSRRDAERMLKTLNARPSIREIKTISEQLNRSIINVRFDDKPALFAALDEMGLKLDASQKSAIAEASYTGWTWTTGNFQRMFSNPDTARILINTALYVGLTLVLFNTGYALVLAISTHYMPEMPASIFRSLWLLPRISPPVIYVLMWKWLTWDTGFLSLFFQQFGIPSHNYLLDSGANAWFFVVLINGFVGASMGMLVFSSALKAIPRSQFYASEVDGASRWQQIRHVVLPQMRWPILFVTCYQTLSLLTSFDLILLSTNGGPGGSTEVWALATYHTALNNYAGNLQYGLGTAMALILVIIGITLALIYLRVFNYSSLVSKPLIEQ